jgi:hypothetical protein
MDAADDAIRDLLRREVLRPTVIDRAVDRAIELLQDEEPTADLRSNFDRKLAALDLELANLVDTVARGGAVPVILDALTRRSEDRRQLAAEIADLRQAPARIDGDSLKAQLWALLDDWRRLLAENVSEARPLLNVVLADRIAFSAAASGGYHLTVTIAFDRMLSAAIPGMLRGLSDRVASPGHLTMLDNRPKVGGRLRPAA